MKTRTLSVVVGTTLSLSACGSGVPAAQTITATSTATATVTTTVTATGEGPSAAVTSASPTTTSDLTTASTGAAGGSNSRTSPVAVGTAVEVGDWTVTLDATNTDATAAIKTGNEFNDDPAAGRQFVMVKAALAYNGDEPQQPSFDLQFTFVGGAGNSFGSGGLDDYCGSIPESLTEVGEMFPDAKATGNECVSVPSDQLAGGVWSVEAGFGNDPVFFALA